MRVQLAVGGTPVGKPPARRAVGGKRAAVGATARAKGRPQRRDQLRPGPVRMAGDEALRGAPQIRVAVDQRDAGAVVAGQRDRALPPKAGLPAEERGGRDAGQAGARPVRRLDLAPRPARGEQARRAPALVAGDLHEGVEGPHRLGAAFRAGGAAGRRGCELLLRACEGLIVEHGAGGVGRSDREGLQVAVDRLAKVAWHRRPAVEAGRPPLPNASGGEHAAALHHPPNAAARLGQARDSQLSQIRSRHPLGAQQRRGAPPSGLRVHGKGPGDDPGGNRRGKREAHQRAAAAPRRR